ncbi:TPA: plasmid recombination protein [Streptococcus suis]|nr:plasmid recombination protein [Streptococcus suis]HEN0301870.1 plasmid recombination protein [Streptococcus agalactiae]
MSYMVARMQKMKVGNLGGAYKHNERVFETHSNKDIDSSKSHLNYELTDRDQSLSYEKQIKDYVNTNKVSNRAIRKDAVLCDEWIITSDKQFFESLTPEQTRAFFETAKNYFAENYGEENIAYASVHLDEKTPHMHMGVVPMIDGKLSSKTMFNREALKNIQDTLPKYMTEHGFEVERGELNSEAKHKTVAEFKQDIASKELEQELLLNYGAPEYINNLGEFVTKKEFQEAYETFQNNLGSLFEDSNFSWRETTFREKMDWVKLHQQEELQKLEDSRKPLEDEIRALKEVIREKYKELDKIDLRASESLSELSEAEEYINTLENHSKGLETKIERLEHNSLRLEKQYAQLVDLKIMSEKDLADIQPKKGLFGKEYVELTKEQFEEFKGLIYRSRTIIHQKEIENEQLRRLVPLRASKNSFEDSLERAKEKTKGESIERLKNEIRGLKNENSVLRQQNDKMFGKLKELMPDKMLNNLVSELKSIKPIVTIVKRVIEKGLGL